MAGGYPGGGHACLLLVTAALRRRVVNRTPGQGDNYSGDSHTPDKIPRNPLKRVRKRWGGGREVEGLSLYICYIAGQGAGSWPPSDPTAKPLIHKGNTRLYI
jgi:hypothetical protein